MQPTDYENAWNGGLDAGTPAIPTGQPEAKPVDDYSSAWHDAEAGPLEKAVRAAGVVPAASSEAKPARKDAKA